MHLFSGHSVQLPRRELRFVHGNNDAAGLTQTFYVASSNSY